MIFNMLPLVGLIYSNLILIIQDQMFINFLFLAQNSEVLFSCNLDENTQV